MSTIAQIAPPVIIGVDTHKHFHVGVALDGLGRRLDEIICPATSKGYNELLAWAERFGEIDAFGIEGTGSFGAGLTRFLDKRHDAVIEVNRPDRSERRSRGKSDPVDAEAAARSVLAGKSMSRPKAGNDRVEMIRMLKVARQGAIKARSQAIISLKALLVNVPDALREQLSTLTSAKLIELCAHLRPGDCVDPTAAAKMALRSLARRYQQLDSEIDELDRELCPLVASAAPNTISLVGVGTEVAGTLLIAAGDNPERLHSESAFAALCGVSPVEASSGKTIRHRLNRGGNRQANSALFTVVLRRLRWDERTQAYAQRRSAEGCSKREIIRCLKRYVAREIYRTLIADGLHRASQKEIEKAA